jgi:putative transposase
MPFTPQPNRTFFVTSVTDGRRALLHSERMARLLLNELYSYRSQGRFLLHEFMMMSNHFHLLITPAGDVSLDKALQFIKGGFSIAQKRSWVSTPQFGKRDLRIIAFVIRRITRIIARISRQIL